MRRQDDVDSGVDIGHHEATPADQIQHFHRRNRTQESLLSRNFGSLAGAWASSVPKKISAHPR